MLTKVILLCALFLIHPSSLLGQGSIDSAQISSLISQFSNADPNVRLTAFYGLLDLSLPFGISTTPYAVTDKTSKLLAVVPTPDVIRLALINLLSQEDRFVQTSNQHFAGDPVLSETYTDYYADLINSVATLHDPRSIPALVGAITSGGTAVGALAAFGNMSIRPTLLELTAPDEGARGFATLTLIGMLDPKNFVNLNAESILGLQRGLVKASGFSESYITVEAGKGLQQLDSKRIEIGIDIRTSRPNPAAKAKIAVLIFSSATFDARSIDTFTLTFGRTGYESSLLFCKDKDEDSDYRRNLVCVFDLAKTHFSVGDTTGVLRGITVGRTPTLFLGKDSLKFVHNRPDD